MSKTLFFIFCFLASLNVEASDLNTTIVSFKEYQPATNTKNFNLHLPMKNGDFTVASLFTQDDETKWAKKFNIVQLGGIDDKKIDKTLLQQKGVLSIPHRLGYDWMPAVYYLPHDPNSTFVDWLYANKESVTLNPNGPYTHCKENNYNWCQDYYYNLENSQLLEHKISQYHNDMNSSGLNGLFFDWGDGGYIDEQNYKIVHDNFDKLNPKKNYYESVGSFYKKLRSLNIFFITNQAFRKEQYLLPFIAYDMTESYITSVKNENIKLQLEDKGNIETIAVTRYYPIYEHSTNIDDSMKFINILTDMKKKYKQNGFQNFIYLNYLAPKYVKISEEKNMYREVEPKNGIYYGYAMAKLTDNIVYAQVPANSKLERDDIYFYDLGTPLDESYKKIDTINGYIRFYTNGFVLVTSAYETTKYLQIESPLLQNKKFIFDAYTGQWINCTNNQTTLKLEYEKDSLSNETLPLGRVYIYNR